jgi:2-polyprenyl-6-methoxyphenol hydroxylase-like FAD-dependent oxidoreductase
MPYDVVIVGARPAGAATAMLLARAGLRVAAVDRARFPSDTLSTHQVQLPGVACLARWGLLDAVIASNCPATRGARFDPGPVAFSGHYPLYDGVDAVYSPRRTVLDTILVDAARAAGAEIIEGFDVTDVVASDDRVTGIRGAERGGVRSAVDISAPLVIGADGKHSLVARTVGARTYDERPARSGAVYAYWDGLEVAGGEMYARPNRAIGAWPTNDGLMITYIAMPAGEFGAFHADAERSMRETFDTAGDLGERIRAATRVEHVRATPDVPNAYRQPYGPGWALVGDAGLVMDPITGQGIGHALCDAQSLSAAVIDGLGGARPLDEALAAHHAARDSRTHAMFDFTTDLASFRPKPGGEMLFRSIARSQERIDELLAVLSGAVPMAEYFAPGNLARIVGLRGMASAGQRGIASVVSAPLRACRSSEPARPAPDLSVPAKPAPAATIGPGA